MRTTRSLTLLAGLASAAAMALVLACEQANSPSAPSASSTGLSAHGSRSHREHGMRWDLVSINFSTGTVSAGGRASARAEDGSTLTLTGSGTFNLGDGDEASGGGTWQTFNASGTQTGSGSYRVRGLVRFDPAPGSFPLPNDRIGNVADARAGLAILEVRYSDGSKGILVVSCHLAGSSDDIFEGITATKRFTTFWNRVAPAPGVDANRTLFHVLDDDDD